MIKIMNMEKDMPYPDVIVADLEKEIDLCKLEDINVLIVIYGYGSKGYGGQIKIETLKKLKELKNKKIIVDYFKGEEWGDFNNDINLLKKQEPELVLNSQLSNLNSGVCIIWINKK